MEEWIKVQKSSDEIKLIQYLELLKLIIRQLEEVKSFQKSTTKVEEQLNELRLANHEKELKIGELLAELKIKDQKITTLVHHQQNSPIIDKLTDISTQIQQTGSFVDKLNDISNKLSELSNILTIKDELLKQKDEKISSLYEQMKQKDKQYLSELKEQVAHKNNQLDSIEALCEKLYTRLIQNDEREVNRKIREYTVNSKHSDPIRFVPTVTKPTYASVPHIGLFSSLISRDSVPCHP